MHLLPMVLEDLFKDAPTEDIRKAHIWLDDYYHQRLMAERAICLDPKEPEKVQFIHPMFLKLLQS